LALKCELEGSKENGWRSVKKVPVKKRPKEAKKILFRAVNLAFWWYQKWLSPGLASCV